MRGFLALLMLLPAVCFAETLVVNEVLIGEHEPLSRPSMEANRVERALARGTWKPPSPGVADSEGVVWRRVQAGEDGWIRDEALGQGYAYAAVNVDTEGTYILEAMGYAGVLVNGEPRIGNVYGYTDDWQPWEPPFDYSWIPVRLQRGTNAFLFYGSRYGLLRARLQVARAPLLLNPRDATLPDLVVREPTDAWGAIVVLNATGEVVSRAKLAVGGDFEKLVVDVPVLPPSGVRKVAFPIRAPAVEETARKSLRVAVSLDGKELDEATLELQVKSTQENRRVTFVSKIDSSVQFYGYLPAAEEPGSVGSKGMSGENSDGKSWGNPGEKSGGKALILSLHGAGVDALNQSGSYAPLSWAYVLAPTNRRPFGFNWEDWGRIDALEVLELGLEQLQIDRDRVYLTGHSMGGHGSWHVATLHPDRFAAVGPSAGWISLWSYRMEEPPGPPSPLAALVERANLPSRTLQMAPNLAALGVYVLHGADDDNVPVAQAHLIVERLKKFHHDFVYHEQPGVGHWWDLSSEPGADCVTWAPMFDFFARHRRPQIDEVREIHFITPSSRISAWNHWACVAAQQRPFVMSQIDLHLDPLSRSLEGTTRNVATLGLSLAHVGLDSLWLELDGESLMVAVPPDGTLWLARDAAWRRIAAPDPGMKGMSRDGTFREAFGNHMQLVYGTQGTPEENAWALAKARYDAEYFWYQGNASVDVLPDSLFDPSAEPERNVVLYGNAGTHAHWRALWGGETEGHGKGGGREGWYGGTVSVERGRLQVGTRQLIGDGLAVLAVRPRLGSVRASVGIVSGTGLPGMHLLDRRPYLTAGVAYPDLTVFEDRGDDAIVRGAGFFGNDWSLEKGEFLWAEEP